MNGLVEVAVATKEDSLLDNRRVSRPRKFVGSKKIPRIR